MAIPLPLNFVTTIHTPFRTIPKSSHRLNPKISIPSSKLYLARAIEESRQSEAVEAEPEVPEMGKEIQKAVEEKSANDLLSGVLEEVREIEWPPFQKVLGTTGVVLGVIAGSSVVLLTVNAVLAELSDKVFADCTTNKFQRLGSHLTVATMASLLHIPTTTGPLFNLRAQSPQNGKISFRARRLVLKVAAYKVVIEHEGKKRELEVEADESILSKALESGMDVPHDCKLGVCMTCPAKLLSGEVDQREGMLSEDVIESGYALLCVAYPKSDCSIKVIPEEELLSLQLATAND